MAQDIILFIIFYFGASIVLVILSLIFRTIIKKLWFLKIPLIFSGIIFFPFGLILIGMYLEKYMLNKDERNYYAGDESMREDNDSFQIDSTIKW